MGYHIGLYLEIKARIKKSSDYIEENFSLEYSDVDKMSMLYTNKYDKRTLKFSIKRKGYPYGGGFINKLIKENDEDYTFILKHFGKIEGRFTYEIMDSYYNLFDYE